MKVSIAAIRNAQNSRLPQWYHWRLHLILNFVIFTAAFIMAGQFLQFDLKTLSIIPGFLILWSALEYLIHRFVLHGSVFSKLHFQQEHSVYHHSYFTDENMELREPIDLNRVLLMPIDLCAVFSLNIVLSSILWLVVDSETSALFFASGALYLFLYEIAHWICHSSLKSNLRVVQRMAHHHRQHHAFQLMRSKNFSILLPWVDTVFGSRADV